MFAKIHIKAFIGLFFLSSLIFGQNSKSKNNLVKVLSFNILHGANTNGSFDLDVIANVIKKADADFVSLQEVDFRTNRAKKYDLPTELVIAQKWPLYLEEQCIMMMANMEKAFYRKLLFYQPEMLLCRILKETNRVQL